MLSRKKITALLAALALGLSVLSLAGCSLGSSSSSDKNSGSPSSRESLDDSNVDQNGWT